MAIGRNFEEAIQKGLRMIGQGMHGFVENKELEIDDIDAALREPTDKRVFVIDVYKRQGLKRLEYRGYDSAGVALISNDGSLNVYKAKGKVADLEAFCSDKDRCV